MLPAASVFVVFWCHLSSLLHRNQLLLSESYMRFSKTYMPLQQAIASFLRDFLPDACNSSAILWTLHSYLQETAMPQTVNISVFFVHVGLSGFLPDASLNYPLPTHIRLISVCRKNAPDKGSRNKNNIGISGWNRRHKTFWQSETDTEISRICVGRG